jgi:multidrug efflux pump subunit AcrB
MSPGGDAIRFLSDIDAEVNALTDLPARAERPVVRELHRRDLVAAVAVSGDMPPGQLEDYALSLEDRLMALPDVAGVEIRGLSRRQWQVEVRRDVLASTVCRRAIWPRRWRARASTCRWAPWRRVTVTSCCGSPTSAARCANWRSWWWSPAKPAASWHWAKSPPCAKSASGPEEQVWFNGQRALVLEVSKSRRGDALNVRDDLLALVEAERRRLEGVRLTLTQDMTRIVRDRLQMLVGNGLTGLVLVVLVMSLFFRPRLALWAVLGLPAAFMGAFAVMAVTGLSLNMITLLALLMAIGIVMDDAIVITDNIAAHALEHASPLKAVVEGTRQVLPGVMSSFLTTVAVFAPLSFLSGEMGSVLEVLPVVLIAALSASLIEAFLILPHHLKGSVPTAGRASFALQGGLRAGFRHLSRARRAHYGRRHSPALCRAGPGVGCAFGFHGICGRRSYRWGGHAGYRRRCAGSAHPDAPGNTAGAHRGGGPAGRGGHAAIDERLTPRQPGGAALVEALQVRFNHNPSAREAGAHVATVIVDLLTAERRGVTLDELTAAWREEIGAISGIQSLIIQEPGFGPAGIPIEVRLQGSDLGLLKEGALELADHLSGYTGVYNVIDNLRPGKPQRRFSLAEGAHGLGLTAEEVAGQVARRDAGRDRRHPAHRPMGYRNSGPARRAGPAKSG